LVGAQTHAITVDGRIVADEAPHDDPKLFFARNVDDRGDPAMDLDISYIPAVGLLALATLVGLLATHRHEEGLRPPPHSCGRTDG
jgi:hypothetical protein